MSLQRQFSTFFGVGVVALIAHYSTMIGLHELAGIGPVTSSVSGYCVGGLVSYLLNRRHTFETSRTHVQAGWRFLAVMAAGFTLTLLSMQAFVNGLGIPYIPAQVMTTGLVFIWNFLAHKTWTFGA